MLNCVVDGPTRGRPWAPTGVRAQLRRLAVETGVRRRTDLGVTSIYLPGIDNAEIINAVHGPKTAGDAGRRWAQAPRPLRAEG